MQRWQKKPKELDTIKKKASNSQSEENINKDNSILHTQYKNILRNFNNFKKVVLCAISDIHHQSHDGNEANENDEELTLPRDADLDGNVICGNVLSQLFIWFNLGRILKRNIILW